eukprot:scaffold28410_cov55-Phaeocystis_antarctica.AAC.6
MAAGACASGARAAAGWRRPRGSRSCRAAAGSGSPSAARRRAAWRSSSPCRWPARSRCRPPRSAGHSRRSAARRARGARCPPDVAVGAGVEQLARRREGASVGLDRDLRVDDGARGELVRPEQWARVKLPPLALHALLPGLGEMQRAEQLDLQLGELVRLVARLPARLLAAAQVHRLEDPTAAAVETELTLIDLHRLVERLVVEGHHGGASVPEGMRLHVARVDAGGLREAAGEVAAVVPQPSRAVVLEEGEGLELSDGGELPRVVLATRRHEGAELWVEAFHIRAAAAQRRRRVASVRHRIVAGDVEGGLPVALLGGGGTTAALLLGQQGRGGIAVAVTLLELRVLVIVAHPLGQCTRLVVRHIERLAQPLLQQRGEGLLLREAAVYLEGDDQRVGRRAEGVLSDHLDHVAHLKVCAHGVAMVDVRVAVGAVPTVYLHAAAALQQAARIHLASRGRAQLVACEVGVV